MEGANLHHLNTSFELHTHGNRTSLRVLLRESSYVPAI